MLELSRHDDDDAMNARQVRLGIDIFTGLVAASVGVALAGLTWRLTGYSGATPVAAVAAGPTIDPVDIGGLLALAPFGTPVAATDAASDGSLHLKGILLAVPASASAALIAGADGKVASYGIGAALGGGVIEAIDADQVVFRTSRGLQVIAFSAALGAPSPVSLSATNTAAGFVAVGTGSGAAASPATIPAGMPAQGGFRVSNSSPAALLAAGLEPGDIVEQINGAPVTAGTNADMVVRNLATAAFHGGNVPIVVLRNGIRVSRQVAIH